ncbi:MULTISPECIES: aminotransferase class I/II-fold pyridoxal phosphate-dependent enzyme [unclassified Ruminococcus]|uniref:aminotransferase class I/II-fold pyridoxal phosphate-dependent enzyme n=1 Tax=unclassified Ruminococcus TaxID=2608920 RepID=UPI00210DE978|nr:MULTISPECIES: aminotransferase class I/II-fold pyridoxal phosphate-dependent enzyme [unclassified Ruminococcus]MCQ4022666.1 aminotransferase class I/II-fold pyridoxal phosphate-dependent enzyme [Ruminococcus sp. zg-924]MCQ4114906.1 aminotransferase class I/II-fold pyridoxal phosphate-dependent enzyme [Ruminococcus sp. zg-921]
MVDYEKMLNSKIQKIKPSGIRRFFDIANEMDHVISLSIGEPDFKTPWHVREEGIRSLEKGKTWYSPNRGFASLRTEICNYFKRRFNVEYHPDKEVLVTVGGSEAIDACIRCIVEAGEEVLIPQPSFVCYEPLAQMADANPVIIETKAENNFRLTPEELESHITPKSKLLILPFPNNPTGAVMRRGDLEAIAEIVEKYNLFVLSDEIYGELTYGGESHVSFSEIKGMKERTVVISGFSKTYAMTGWRLGYALGPEAVLEQMTKLHQFAIMSAPTTAQYAAIEALKNGDSDIENMKKQYDMRRRLVVGSFQKMGLDCFEPHGAFYCFPSIKNTGLTSEEFCLGLINSKHVAVVPGNAFGECGEGFIRVSYSYSLNHLGEALNRIEEYLKEIKK